MESLKNVAGVALGILLVIAYLAVGVLMSCGAAHVLGGPETLSDNSLDMLLLLVFVGPGVLVYLVTKAVDYVREGNVPKNE